jgi:aldose 1-epimerase
MDTNQQFCFTHPSGEDIYLFALHNSKGTKVLISNYGAIISSFEVKQPNGQTNDIVLGFDKMEDYIAPSYLHNYPWLGAAVGRYGNRIKDASFKIDGHSYQLSRNNGSDQLHGGTTGFDKKVWRLVSFSGTALELHYLSPDGEEGYPGNLSVTIRFELGETNELSYEYTAVCDQPTAVNLTHHGYFNLDNDKGSIAQHEVKLYSTQYLEQGDNFVATGRLINTKNTPYDFSQWKKISRDWNPADGYDQSFVVDNKNDTTPGLVAEARSPQSGLQLEVWSTEPVVHFYTGKYIPSIKGKQGIMYGPYSAFCLETQVHPNAVNISHFPNTILRPGETYRQKTLYRVVGF